MLKVKILRNDNLHKYKYNCQIYTKSKINNKYYYCGFGKFFQNLYEAINYKKQIEKMQQII